MLVLLGAGPEDFPMRELTTVELHAVSGGLMTKPPSPHGHRLLRLIVRLVLVLLHHGKPGPTPRRVAA